MKIDLRKLVEASKPMTLTIARDLKAFWAGLPESGKRKVLVGVLILIAVTFTYAMSGTSAESQEAKLVVARESEFKKDRILGDPYAAVGAAREQSLNRTAKDYSQSQKVVSDAIGKIDSRLGAIEARLEHIPPASQTPANTTQGSQSTDVSAQGDLVSTGSSEPQGQERGPHATFSAQASGIPSYGQGLRYGNAIEDRGPRGHKPARGPAVVTFPVPGTSSQSKAEVVLPVGSFVKAKLLTGVEAPEGTPYPVLMQLDFAHILPNNKSLDLKGCFIIAKAQGDLSTERVQMQATKLSCVARSGRMFERDINGFVADAKDNSFAVIGSVNTKQDRVAGMAFLSAIVEGISKAIQMAQTSEVTASNGSSTRVLTGDQGKYIAAGGAGQAGSMVAQWYLKQAQNLLPTINVGSGQDVWIVMHETVALPSDYFKKISLGVQSENDQFVNRLFD